MTTKPEMLRVQPLKRYEIDIEKRTNMENTYNKIRREYQLIYKDFGRHVSRLQIVQSWVRTIFANPLARRFLEKNYPDILRRFNDLVDLTDLNDITDEETPA